MSTAPASSGRGRRLFWILIGLAVAVLLLGVPIGIRAYRLTGIPELPEPFDVSAFPVGRYNVPTALLQPMSKAAQAQFDSEMKGDWSSVLPEVRAWLQANQPALEQFRDASERPEYTYFSAPGTAGHLLLPAAQDTRSLSWLATLQGMKLESEGDFHGAWTWYRAVLQSSRHLGQHGTNFERFFGMALHARASDSIVRWAEHAEVDAALLRVVRDEARAIDRTTAPLSSTLKAEYAFARDALNDPNNSATQSLVMGEPELSRRLMNVMWTNWLGQCDLPRPERSRMSTADVLFFDAAAPAPTPPQIDRWVQRSLMLKSAASKSGLGGLFVHHDRERARQVMLELTLCLQIYRRENGVFPATLPALVGRDLAELPVDPFGKGEPIRYRLDLPKDGATLWSIGPDGTDDGGQLDWHTSGNQTGDLIVRVKVPHGDQAAK